MKLQTKNPKKQKTSRASELGSSCCSCLSEHWRLCLKIPLPGLCSKSEYTVKTPSTESVCVCSVCVGPRVGERGGGGGGGEIGGEAGTKSGEHPQRERERRQEDGTEGAERRGRHRASTAENIPPLSFAHQRPEVASVIGE